MSNSLFDQLKKSGLVDERRAKKINKEKYNKNKQQRRTGTVDQGKLLTQQALAKKAEHARVLNKQRKEDADHKAIAAQVKQLIESNRIKDRDGDIAYRFTDASIVKQIHVTVKLQQQLGRGQLAIVKLGNQHELVPSSVAEKIRERDADCVLLYNEEQPDPDSKKEMDDPYADYQIPDDLMW